MNARALHGLAVLLLAATLVACGDKQDPVQIRDSGLVDAGDPVTWCDDIAPIITTVCTQCHSVNVQGGARNGAPPSINFDTYQDTLANLSRANINIQAGTMPPNDGIPQADRDLFQQWVDQSAPACLP